jgi:hypothetical protein
MSTQTLQKCRSSSAALYELALDKIRLAILASMQLLAPTVPSFDSCSALSVEMLASAFGLSKRSCIGAEV